MELSNDDLTRRRVIRIGGLSVAAAVVLAACKKSVAAKIPNSGAVDPVNTALAQNIDDIVLLRTASSLEYVMIDLYQYVFDKGLLPASTAVAAKLFQTHHREHAKQFESLTTISGGEPFAMRNEVVWNGVVAPVLTKDSAGNVGLHDEQTVLEFVYRLEGIAASSYQSIVTTLTTPSLRKAVMAIGGAEARHETIIAGLIPRATLTPLLKSQTAATTTVAGPTTTSATADRTPVYKVPGTFAPLTLALGPNSFEYYTVAASTTTTAKV